MARSVSTPSNAVEVAYQDVRDQNQLDQEWWIEDIREHARSLWPSFDECDTWLGREDHAILENGLCYLGISEHCGLASIWLVPKDDHYPQDLEPLARQFIAQVAGKFHETFGQLRCVGRFSNGEAIYELIDKSVGDDQAPTPS